jgi:preprotein translocase subunit SecA
MGEARTRDIEKKITLFAIDRCWAQHLAHIADIREGIHLTGVGGESPIRQFVKIVDHEFQGLEAKIYAEILEIFTALPLTEEGIDLESAGIKGPSSTWTYLISDNQFGMWVGLLQGSNIGFAAGAAAWYGPLYLLMAMLQRGSRKMKD